MLRVVQVPNYNGPDFSELDDTLQQAFVDFLEDRDVTAELGDYIAGLMADKKTREYLGWLRQVKSFISA